MQESPRGKKSGCQRKSSDFILRHGEGNGCWERQVWGLVPPQVLFGWKLTWEVKTAGFFPESWEKRNMAPWGLLKTRARGLLGHWPLD